MCTQYADGTLVFFNPGKEVGGVRSRNSRQKKSSLARTAGGWFHGQIRKADEIDFADRFTFFYLHPGVVYTRHHAGKEGSKKGEGVENRVPLLRTRGRQSLDK